MHPQSPCQHVFPVPKPVAQPQVGLPRAYSPGAPRHDVGLAVHAIRTLAKHRICVSGVICAESSEAARSLAKSGAPASRPAAVTLWRCAREGLSEQAQRACQFLHSHGVPARARRPRSLLRRRVSGRPSQVPYVLLAKSEAGARAVIGASLPNETNRAALEANCAFVWRNARHGS